MEYDINDLALFYLYIIIKDLPNANDSPDSTLINSQGNNYKISEGGIEIIKNNINEPFIKLTIHNLLERLKEIDIDDKELQKIISIQDDKTFVIDKIEFVKEQLSDDLNIVNLLRHDDFKGNKGNFRKNMIVLRLLFFTTILNFLNEKPEHFVSSSSPGIAIKNIFNINSARNIAESQTGCDFSLSSSDFYNLSFSDLWTKKIQPYLSNCLEPIADKRNAATTLAYIEALKNLMRVLFQTIIH